MQHNLLEPRQPHDGVGDAARAMQLSRRRVRVPHANLKHVVGLLPHAVGETEGVKDLEAAALEAVGLAADNLGVALVDDARANTEVGHPAGGHEAGGC